MAQATTTTGAGITMYRTHTDRDTLGIDTSLPGCENIDIDASVDEYDRLFDEMLTRDYPDVTIVIDEKMGLRVFDDSATGNPEDSDAARAVLGAATDIAEQLFNDGTLWAVKSR